MESANTYNGWPHHRNLKRSHEVMEGDSASAARRPSPAWPLAASPTSSSSTPHTHRPHPQTSNLHLPPLRGRFAGDGLDFRRPVMSTAQAMPPHAADIIDLTSEDDPSLSDSSTQQPYNPPPLQSTRASRPPRFAREIIDLSEDTPQDMEAGGRHQAIHIPSSPEVQIVSSRRIPSRAPPQSVDLTDDDLVDGTWQEGVNRGPPGTGGHRTRVAARDLPPRSSHLERRIRELFGGNPGGHRAGRANRSASANRRQVPNRAVSRFGINIENVMQPIMNFIGPGPMDYDMPAFNLGGHTHDPTPPPPTYDPPQAAEPGFTRSPEENEVVVCPNCDAELCSGPEDSEKRQVWIVKACGHAYCGECAQNRHSSKRKGKEPAGSASTRLPQPFSRCVVKGCEKKCTARTAMIQLFF